MHMALIHELQVNWSERRIEFRTDLFFDSLFSLSVCHTEEIAFTRPRGKLYVLRPKAEATKSVSVGWH